MSLVQKAKNLVSKVETGNKVQNLEKLYSHSPNAAFEEPVAKNYYLTQYFAFKGSLILACMVFL